MNSDRHSALQALAALFFPPSCIACGELLSGHVHAGPFCSKCLDDITPVKSPLCSTCGLQLPVGPDDPHRLCENCLLTPPPFSRLRTWGFYDGPLLAAIHRFKYQKNMTAGKNLALLMARWEQTLPELRDCCDRIIPVPLHPSKLRRRGFNQSLVLARQIARNRSLPLDTTTLIKVSDGSPQVKLGRKERRQSVLNRFAIARGKSPSGLRILLVDDVHTTGSTLRECSKILMKGGAREVTALALARA